MPDTEKCNMGKDRKYNTCHYTKKQSDTQQNTHKHAHK